MLPPPACIEEAIRSVGHLDSPSPEAMGAGFHLGTRHEEAGTDGEPQRRFPTIFAEDDRIHS